MNGRERVLAAMRMEDPGEVPIWCHLSQDHMIKNSSIELDDYLNDTDKCIKVFLESWELYGFDGVIVSRPGSLPEGKENFTRSNYEIPEDMSKFKIESWGKPIDSLPNWWDKTYRQIVELLGNDVVVGGWLPDPFARTHNNFARHLGNEKAFLAMIEFPEEFHRMLDFFCEEQTTIARAQIAAGVDCLHISNAWAGASLISLDHYREFVLPYLQRFLRAISTPDVFFYIHTCGFINDRLELMAESGVNGIECMDPPPLGNVDLEDAKARIGDRVFLKGNIDPVNVLLQGTEQEIIESVERCLRVGLPGGGYILSTACSIPPGVPPERVKLIIEIGRNWKR